MNSPLAASSRGAIWPFARLRSAALGRRGLGRVAEMAKVCSAFTESPPRPFEGAERSAGKILRVVAGTRGEAIGELFLPRETGLAVARIPGGNTWHHDRAVRERGDGLESL